MINLSNLIGEYTAMVIDSPSNRFNFIYMVEVDAEMGHLAENGYYWSLAELLPADVQRAIDTMEENGVLLGDYTGVISYDVGDDTYYILTW